MQPIEEIPTEDEGQDIRGYLIYGEGEDKSIRGCLCVSYVRARDQGLIGFAFCEFKDGDFAPYGETLYTTNLAGYCKNQGWHYFSEIPINVDEAHDE